MLLSKLTISRARAGSQQTRAIKRSARRANRVLMKQAIKTDFINATTALFMTEGREDREERVEVKGCNSDCSGHRARAV